MEKICMLNKIGKYGLFGTNCFPLNKFVDSLLSLKYYFITSLLTLLKRFKTSRKNGEKISGTAKQSDSAGPTIFRSRTAYRLNIASLMLIAGRNPLCCIVLGTPVFQEFPNLNRCPRARTYQSEE
jgi:hypothetical protein